MLSQKRIDELEEIIVSKIAHILHDVYGEKTDDLSVQNVRGKLMFKGDPHLNELRLALERIQRKEYGICIFCKGEIGYDILYELPTAHFCRNCADSLVQRRNAAVSGKRVYGS
ncbi:MAG: hypothetical protein CL946_11950 [Ectothiorhodospiraceae bacterium]|nr:hypothetical protein [Ectothiorhodospiraceae bacterium]